MITLSQTLVGHLRGGLAQVVTIFSMFFAGISGSSAADVAILSRTLAPEMKREGYDLAFTAALIASASTMANLIPPSIMAVVYGATGNVSIGGLFLGGVVPGVFVGIGLMIYSYFFGPVGLRHKRATFGKFAHRHQASGDPADDSVHHHGRHPHRPVHADRSRHHRGGLHPVRGDPAAQSAACQAFAARHGADRPALFDPADHHRRRIGVRLDAGLSARPRGGVGLDLVGGRRRSLPDHAAAGRAVRRRRRLHRRDSRPSSSSCRSSPT